MNTDEEKRCCTCKKQLPLTAFYKNRTLKDGLAAQCKLCIKRYIYSEARRRYKRSDQGKAANMRYLQSEKYKLKQKKSSARQRVLHRDRFQVRGIVSRAIRASKVPCAKDLKCIRCAGPAHLWHHHLGYKTEHVMDIIPMCFQCHGYEHRTLRYNAARA